MGKLVGFCDRVVLGEKLVSEVWARIDQNLQTKGIAGLVSGLVSGT